MLTTIGILLLLASIAWLVYTFIGSAGASSALRRLEGRSSDTTEQEKELNEFKTKLAGTRLKFGVPGVLLGIFVLITSSYMFYAEPGYIYHVRTMTGAEKVVTNPGYKVYYFGRWNAWKRDLTVQSVNNAVASQGVEKDDRISAETDTKNTSATLPPVRLMFLDNVDAISDATVRFSLPSDEESFLKMAHAYRNPDNLLRTSLVPAFKETLQATASLMSAEVYYSGGRTLFNNEFENQMSDGIYLVNREIAKVDSNQATKSTANASLDEQKEYEGGEKTEFVVTKKEDANGNPLRNTQKFVNFGITVVDARITDMNPNTAFLERMKLKQQASADRAIAREQRIQEQEQKLLAVSKGERQVAERQAKAKVEQIQKTTEAETTKQLVLTKANQQKEQAEIDKQTAQIQLEKARIDADRIKTLANAEAHKKKVLLNADNALQPKLDAEVKIQQLWADAYAKRKVPQYVFGGSDGSTPTGGDGEVNTFMKLMTVEAAKNLNYTREVKK